MNRDRQKAVGKVFFDLTKYLLTTVAVSSFMTENFKIGKFIIGIIVAFLILIVAYYITPKDKN